MAALRSGWDWISARCIGVTGDTCVTSLFCSSAIAIFIVSAVRSTHCRCSADQPSRVAARQAAVAVCTAWRLAYEVGPPSTDSVRTACRMARSGSRSMRASSGREAWSSDCVKSPVGLARNSRPTSPMLSSQYAGS